MLKLAGDVVEQHAAYLGTAEAGALCGWALQLLRTYSAHNLVGGRGFGCIVCRARECQARSASASLGLRLHHFACGPGSVTCPVLHAACTLRQMSLLRLIMCCAAPPEQGQVSGGTSSAMAAEALSERYLDLRALLKLLTRLTQAEWAEVEGGGGGVVPLAAGAAGQDLVADVAEVRGAAERW